MGWLVFIAGSGLGYFLERWGTTRECWTYYTYQTPPFFAVLAHGMAAVVFWRVGKLMRVLMSSEFFRSFRFFRSPMPYSSKNGKIDLMNIMSIDSRFKTNLAGILSQYPILAAYLFGSTAEGRATPLSDVDIALVFDQARFSASNRLQLELEIEDQVSQVCEIPNADVRIINDAPLVIQGEVLTNGILLYSPDEEARVDYETRTRMEYFDFQLLIEQEQSGDFEVLSAIFWTLLTKAIRATLPAPLLRSLPPPAYSALRVPLRQYAWRASTAPGFPMAAGFPAAARRGCGCALASAGA